MGVQTIERHLTLSWLLDVVLYTRLYLAVGAALWAYALAVVLGESIDLITGTIVAATAFGLYALNRLSDLEEDRRNAEHASVQRTRITAGAGAAALLGGFALATVIVEEKSFWCVKTVNMHGPSRRDICRGTPRIPRRSR